MRKNIINISTGVLTCFIAIGATLLLSGKMSQWFETSLDTSRGSCQVKQIGPDRHAVWMSCEEWKRRNQWP